MFFSRDYMPGLFEDLSSDKILLLIGARQVGKTSLMKQLQQHLVAQGKPTVFLYTEQMGVKEALDEHQDNLWQYLPNSKERIYVFIDEIQYLQDPTRFLKYQYDKWSERIKLIVSGSSAFYINTHFRDSLAGRKKIVHIKTLNFREYLHFLQQDHLIADNGSIRLHHATLLHHYTSRIVWGGYPEVVLAPTEEQKKEVFKELVYSYIKKDIYESGAKDEESYYKIMVLLASQTGKLVNSQEIASMIGKNRLTVQAYMRTMQQSFHLQLVKPFHGSSRKELTKMPKVYFWDTGLANYLTQHLLPRATLGSHTGTLLENTVWKQLVDRYDIDEIRFRRTQQGHEVDFIIPHLSKAYEVKIDATKFAPSKYIQFTTTYPAITLSPIDLKKSLDLATE